jgi:hypothetical protein
MKKIVTSIDPYTNDPLSSESSYTNVTVTSNPNTLLNRIPTIGNRNDTFWDNIHSSNATSSMFSQPHPLISGFNCYSTTQGRISQSKLDLIYKILAETKLCYEQVLKHLGMEERLFNTILMEYSIKFKAQFLIELLSHKQVFTKEDLFNQVVKSYS